MAATPVRVPAGQSGSNQSMVSSVLSSSPLYMTQSARSDSVCSTDESESRDYTCNSTGRKHKQHCVVIFH